MSEAMTTLFGMNIITVPEIPRYQLPAEIIPGLPWPEKYRQEVNQWALRVCGTTSIVPDGQMLMMPGSSRIYMCRDDHKVLRVATERMKP